MKPALRVRLMPRIVAAIAAAAAVTGACGGGDSPPAAYLGTTSIPPHDLPAEILTDTSGKSYDLRSEADGHVTLVYVGYTHCPDICPTHMYELSEGLKLVDPKVREQVKVVFVTADPERDTGPVLRKWLDIFDTKFVGLTGTPREVMPLIKALRLETPTRTDLGDGYYTVTHAPYVIAFTKDGLGHLVYPQEITAQDWAHDLPLLVKEDWK